MLIHPGLVRTDMNAVGTIETSESVSGMWVFQSPDQIAGRMLTVFSLKVMESGSAPLYVDYNGNELPW